MKPISKSGRDALSEESMTRSNSFLFHIFVLILIFMLLGVLNKFLLGRGLVEERGQLITISNLDVLFSRISVGVMLAISIFITIQLRVHISNIKIAILFWFPIVIFLWLEIPFLSEDFSIVFRTINFIVVITTASFLAANNRFTDLFYSHLFWVIAVTNTIGTILFFFGNSISYSTDGYGLMFTGLYPHKDILSTVAAVGVVIAIARMINRFSKIDFCIFVSQLICLYMSATLSSVLAVMFTVAALKFPRLSILLAGLFAITLPLISNIYADAAIAFGKDPTFTGRTILWDFTISHGMEKPLLGHGFYHASDLESWTKMLNDQFKTDRFFIPHSHNLWVEVFYKFGLVGLALVAYKMWVVPLRLFTLKIRDLSYSISFLLLPFWLTKSALTVPFMASDTGTYLWAFSLTHFVVRSSFNELDVS